MEQRMITGNGGSGRSKEAESHRNESLVDSITSYATIGALGGTVSTPRSANTAMQHAPFKLNGNSSPSMLSSLQGSIFDTPPSLNNSPMYHSLFSSPLGGFTSPSRVVLSCSLCNGDCARDMNAIHFNTCKHIYCGGCATLGAGDGKICAMCTLSTIHKQPPFSLQHFTDRQKQGDLDTALPSGMGEGVGLSHLWDSSSSRHCSPQSFLTTSMTPLSIAPVERSSNFASSLICAACQEGQLATHYCKQCREPLCTDCVGAHQRVRITRGHHIIVLETSHSQNAQCTQQDLLSETSLSLPTFPGIEICSPEHVFMPTSALGGSTCRLHTGMPLKFRCDTTSCSLNGPICLRCLAEHQNHQISIIGDAKSVFRMIVGDLRQDEKFIDEAISSVQHMCERVDASVRSTANELRSEIHKHVSALEERKRELLQRVETVRNVKQATLKRQADELVQRRAHLSQVLRSVDQHYENSGASFSSELLNLVSKVVSYRLGFLDPFEIDLIRFTVPDSQLITKNRTLGDLESGPSAQKTTIISERFNRAILDRQCTIQVQLRDACGETICVSGYAQFLTASLTDPIGASVELNICERDVGVVSISFQPIQEGKHVLNIMIHGLAISGCPVSIDARRGRNYQDICDRGELFHFGTEGSEDGELCRPWGICCDHKGRVIVADRSNNRIQIFDGDGRFLMKFGSGGSRAGQFDRPAGICTNSLNHIVVADKDNHRIQVFDELGNFVLKFGERGRPVGMFNYPWGVATNSQNNIAVSDTRNHRVQIFTCNGQFIRKCGFDTAYFYKHLDSPRGVCYLPDGQLLITDFNNHRVVMMNQRSGTDMKCYGSEGDQEGMFLRPQGIKTDLEGHILVCDSRNNRIQVFSADDMCCVATFGGAKLALAPPPGLQLTTPTVSASTNMVLPPSSPTSPPSLLSLTTQLTGIGTPLFTDFSSPPPNAFSLPADGDVSVDQRVEDTPVGSGSNDHEISEPALLDRPTDLCVGPDGRIYVVDFGHNCIRVF